METGARVNKLLLDTQQYAGHPEEADEQLVLGVLMDHHTCTPGILQSFNPIDQTATVQPAIRRLLLPDGRLVQLPLCVNVPCFFPGGVLTFEVTTGMDVVLAVAERAIDGWWSRGGVQDPTEMRQFDLSDSFAYIGFSAKPNALSDMHSSATELRTRAGGNRVSVRQDGTVHIGTAASLSTFLPLVNGVVMARGIDTYTKMTYGALGAASQNVMVKP